MAFHRLHRDILALFSSGSGRELSALAGGADLPDEPRTPDRTSSDHDCGRAGFRQQR